MVFFLLHTLSSIRPIYMSSQFIGLTKPSSSSRVKRVSSRFSIDTWKSTAQSTMRPRDLQRSQPLWRTTACCPSTSCSNYCGRPRHELCGYCHHCLMDRVFTNLSSAFLTSKLNYIPDLSFFFLLALHWFWFPIRGPGPSWSYSQWLHFPPAQVQPTPQLTKSRVFPRQAHI